MKKALYINIGGEGHLNPTLRLVHNLIERGDSIVYYSSNDFEEKIKKTGAQYRPLDQEAQKGLSKNMKLMISHPKEYLLHFFNAMEKMTDSILEEISEEKYDYILYDAQSLPGKWVAHRSGLLSIATSTTFAFSQELKENMNLTGTRNIEQKQERLAMLQAFLQLEEIAKQKQYLEEKYEIPLPDNFLLCPGSSDLNIVFTSRYFQRNSEGFKDDYIFIGPSIVENEVSNDFSADELKGRHVIYISMGTIMNNQPEFYQKCFTGLKDLNVKVILSIGKQLTVKQLGNIPDNFIVRNYLSQINILRQADVFISHCGMNSISESLYFEVPLVMLPLINDQHTIAERVHELGAGFMLNIQQLSAEDLKHAVNEVLRNSIYKENAKKISQSFRESGGYMKAVDEIITFTR
ncbi:glycosyl transferase [Bacillus toyonensis]|uniref:macrolide family glycosyltransferase n=1 Tax=Bacillus toyonensis TaxID=155322 RepID=UPI0021D18F67|nr:macrolide family glycosyltransferase [Bacillus toyonensis]MCU4767799.1 glycosyl transferase [Bacillus toyonensis]MCU5581253.1 glycosyl transferase [Bacillus toyonensis]